MIDDRRKRASAFLDGRVLLNSRDYDIIKLEAQLLYASETSQEKRNELIKCRLLLGNTEFLFKKPWTGRIF